MENGRQTINEVEQISSIMLQKFSGNKWKIREGWKEDLAWWYWTHYEFQKCHVQML